MKNRLFLKLKKGDYSFGLKLFLIGLFLPLFGNSSTLHVPSDYASIQLALDVAEYGDTVLVAPGIYTESINWPETDGILLTSSGDQNNTIIESELNNRAVLFSTGFPYTNATKISDFTFTGSIIGDSGMNGWGIFMASNASPIIESIHFANYTFLGDGDSNAQVGGLIYMEDNCHPIVRNCLISKFNISGITRCYGLAFHIENNCNPSIENIEIKDGDLKVESWLYGVAFHIAEGCSPTLNNIYVHDLSIKSLNWGYGCGAYIVDYSDPIINDFSIERLSLDSSEWFSGGGLFIESYCSPEVNNFSISEMTVNGASRVYGGAIQIEDFSNPTFTNTTIQDMDLHAINYFRGGGILIEDSCNLVSFDSLRIDGINGYSERNIFGLNILIDKSDGEFLSTHCINGIGIAEDAVWGGGAFITNGSHPIFDKFIFCNNELKTNATGSLIKVAGAGVRISFDSHPTFINGLITDNVLDGNAYNAFGSGLYLSRNCLPTFINCTIANNSSTNGATGSGLYHNFDNIPTFTNVIMRNEDDGGEIGSDGSGIELFTYSNIRQGATGEGNIDVDPDFKPECYYLNDTSPSFRTGTNEVDILTDLNGLVRLYDGAVNPSMGPYENRYAEIFSGNDTILVCVESEYILSAAGYDNYWWATGETTREIEVIEDGMQTVFVGNGCCELTDSVYVKFLTDCDPVDTNKTLPDLGDFCLYPNPAQNKFTITVNPDLELDAIEVYDATGRLIYVQELVEDQVEYSIFAAHYSRGAYLLVVRWVDGERMAKFLVLQ